MKGRVFLLIKDILINSGLKKGDSFLDIGYYNSGVFLEEALKIIGNVNAYVLDLQKNAFYIRSKLDKTNVINLFLSRIENKINLPFKDYFIDFSVLNFEIINNKNINLEHFLSEINRVLSFKKKIILLDKNLEFSNILNVFLEKAGKENLTLRDKGYFKEGVFYFLARKSSCY